ncbi:hypothetical protein FXO38_16462 [Capsicum annuum]|uniref:Uncharacterized protein n=1 Tax=Capsicum annuum TaxID=4072 RepID=A0A2G2Z239_CAPAN|nr:hypothetical protein FXO37_29763 [Capsicum annuum]KAF3651702.1 hypothetical protein FXO38_16462 [Capsicum annuum]PHT75925.1 hypothetical protein T459_19447 [Capsicum annuum]
MQRVVPLALPDLQLQDTISQSLVNLSFLNVLILGNYSIHGSILYGLGHMPHLQAIDIQNNQLQVCIPTCQFNIREFKYFHCLSINSVVKCGKGHGYKSCNYYCYNVWYLYIYKYRRERSLLNIRGLKIRGTKFLYKYN